MTVKTMIASRLQQPSAWLSHVILSSLSQCHLQCWLATLAAAYQSPPEFRVSWLLNLIKITGSRDQLIHNIVVQFLIYTCAVPSLRPSEWLLSCLMRSLQYQDPGWVLADEMRSLSMLPKDACCVSSQSQGCNTLNFGFLVRLPIPILSYLANYRALTCYGQYYDPVSMIDN